MTITDFTRIPIIRLWDLILVPLQGEIGDQSAQQLVDEVLERVRHNDITGLLIDVTGLWLMDSHLCSMLSRLAASAALMGTRTVISGMSPDNALTLQTMGLELRSTETVLDLEEALEILGIHSTRAESHDDDWMTEGEHEGPADHAPKHFRIASQASE
jgi:rsbT antagonist protein RsbS